MYVSEKVILGPQLIEETVQQIKMIQEKIKVAQDRQKSYTDLKRREEEYEVGEKVLLRVSPVKGVMRFGKKGKLNPNIPDKSHVLQPKIVQIDENLSYEERPIKILDSKVRSTRNKDVKIVKVHWSNKKSEEATWEVEAEMRKKYPEFFAEAKKTRAMDEILGVQALEFENSDDDELENLGENLSPKSSWKHLQQQS
ncbi:uncharacterized protein LOC109136307 [Beta vulgaris subsp. vulgaris]|uniref:uncharacterized protein LOC109136307 n=1 Tax=Beta vulgaris subsp. vulgaris TaxID=3555 RepID=UPI00090067C7|nr:uncharacterized protein LOC109136307 [Beta vulgaris subsp. vulgaris]